MRTLVLALLALTLAGLGAGCGSDNAAETDVTPAAAAAEIDTIKSTLDDALAKYEGGDAKAAEQLVGDAYLEHYEELEHPLEEADKELMEDLEHTLSTEIRAKLKAGAPAAEVKQLIVATKADLDRAKAALQD